MLRVLQIGPLPPPWGGVQTNLDGIQQYLRRHGHQSAGVNITRHRRANSPEAYFPQSAPELLRLLSTLPYDFLHLHLGGRFSPRLTALCLAVTAIPGKRSILSFHSGGYPSSPEGQNARKWSLPGFVLRRFDRIIVVNEELRHVFGRFGVTPERCRVIAPHWIPAQTPELVPSPLADFFSRHQRIILSVGLLEPEYDLPRQLEVFERIDDPGAGLLWIGSGSLENELRKRIESSPAAERILLAGDIPRPQTLAAIARATLLWRTTLYDGDAVSVREALHFGTPVVATDNGMRPDGLRLIPVADSQALLDATLSSLHQPRPEASQQDGEANLRAVVNLYSELV